MKYVHAVGGFEEVGEELAQEKRARQGRPFLTAPGTDPYIRSYVICETRLVPRAIRCKTSSAAAMVDLPVPFLPRSCAEDWPATGSSKFSRHRKLWT